MSNTKEKAPINWHFTCQLTRIYENFKEQYFRSIKSASWLFEEFKVTMTCKRKRMSWLGCTRQCKNNWKGHHIQNQSKCSPWYLINGLEYTVQNILISLNTLFRLHVKSKKQVKSKQNLILKKGKTITLETLHMVTSVFEYDNISRWVLEKKDYVSVSKGVHKEKLSNLQKSL